MGKSLQLAILLVTIPLLLIQCRKKQWDEYYGRPEGLEPPIYQVLQARGNFTSMLRCIDKAGYKDILSNAGYWTLFAPTDEAFTQFFKENSIGGIESLDSLTAQKIVRYCLVYNSFNTDRLDDYQATSGWSADDAFKRRTTYYELFDTATLNGQVIHIVASNRNGSYVSSDNNNKYIPYFTNPFLAKRKLTATDYTYFYPGITFSGMNVMDATITETNIAAENGFIHVINKVLTPALNIEKYLATKPEYSLFKSLFDRFMIGYLENADATHRYQVLNNSSDKVYVKFYNSGLAFSLNNENYLKTQDNDGQNSGWTLFAPTNDVLEPYLKSVLLEHYNNDINNIDKLPYTIITDFLNAHMWQSPVWPSKFVSTMNYLGEEARFDPNADVLDKKILSNGFFYGVHKVQESNLFSTVYTRPYLDPSYSMMTRLLNEDLKNVISNPNFRYTILMMSDDEIHQMGYNWNGNRGAWEIIATGADGKPNMLRLLNLHVIATPKNELSDLSGEGIIETVGGEMIKYKNGHFYAAGNIDDTTMVSVTDTKQTKNGIAYYTDRLLHFSTMTVGKRLEQLSATSASPYYNFFQYLKNSKLYNTSTGAVSAAPLGFFGTFLIPDNNAIVAAVNAGLLPGTGTAPNMVPNFTPADSKGQDLVTTFIQYHILKKSVIPDGKTDGAIESTYQNLDGLTGNVTIINSGGTLVLTDGYGRTATLNLPASNVLADRIVFHSINNYLQYNN